MEEANKLVTVEKVWSIFPIIRIILLSSALVLSSLSTVSTWLNKFSFTISILLGTPSFILLGVILTFTILLFFCFLSHHFVMLSRIALIPFSVMIGHSLSLYGTQLILTDDIEFAYPRFALSFIVAVVWGVVVYLTTVLYSPRMTSEISHISPQFIWFEVLMCYFPLFSTALSDLPYRYFHSIFHSVFALVLAFIIHRGCPYISERTNSFYKATLITSIPFSFLFLFHDYLVSAVTSIIIFSIVTHFICNKTCHFSKPVIDYECPEEEAEFDHDQETDPSQIKVISFHHQDIFVGLFLMISLLQMVYFNAIAAQRMPSGVLPDLLHEKFSFAGAFRASRFFNEWQISNLICIFLAVSLIAFIFTAYKVLNVRRSLLIYSIMASFRAVAFLVTSLPPPCAGLEKCPCADPQSLATLRAASPYKIAASWLFGLGMFLKYPQCGDLIISGHTMFIWLAFLTFSDVVNKTVKWPFRRAIQGSLLVFIIAALIYIILVRNHYTIDVLLGIALPQLLWTCYQGLMEHSKQPETKTDHIHLRFIRWFEYREFPLVTHCEADNPQTFLL